MRAASLLSTFGYASHVAAATCNANNCARAVTGTFKSTATALAHRADCSSFLSCTAYPATSTVTTTATVFPTTFTSTVFPVTVTQLSTYITLPVTGTTITVVSTAVVSSIDEISIPVIQSTVTVTAPQRKRHDAVITSQMASNSVVCPSRVPAYASPCSGTARYSSACSCFGVSKTTTTMSTPTVTVTATSVGQTTVTISATQTITPNVAALTTVAAYTTIITTAVQIVTETVIVPQTTIVTVPAPAQTGNAYCSNGQPVNGLSPACTSPFCSTTNLRIEGLTDTVYEGIILSGPTDITTPSGGTHVCDGTNNNANPVPGANGISTIAAAAGLCGFPYDGPYMAQFQDFQITKIGSSDSNTSPNEFWGILLNYVFTPAGGCETEVKTTDELLWAFNAFNVNFFLRVQPTQTPVVLAPGASMTFTVQGSDGNGNFSPVSGALFNGQTSNGNGQVTFTAPTTPGTYRYKATRSDSIRSNAVTVIVRG